MPGPRLVLKEEAARTTSAQSGDSAAAHTKSPCGAAPLSSSCG